MNSTIWYLYLIRCRDGSLYTGISTDVSRRFGQHQKAGQGGSKYLKGRGPLVLAYHARVGPRSIALKVESRVKKLAKNRKEQLLQKPHFLETIIQNVKNETEF
jgi:putative endonuclease